MKPLEGAGRVFYWAIIFLALLFAVGFVIALFLREDKPLSAGAVGPGKASAEAGA